MVGRSYRLLEPISSLAWKANKQHIMTVPDGAIVTVLEDPDSEKMLAVEWSHTRLTMFAVDLERRGELVTDQEPDSQSAAG
ncbi:MAG: hypothetical protein JWO19_1181 [Bryobacterales bacterium]|jgi:hypothetical protein|nr:hypothetical protein [Bryobacterales bacterium]